MARNAKIDRLKAVPLFSSCSQKELALVARASDELTVAADREVVKEGALGREFFLILEGSVVVRRGKRTVARLGPGQYFGELALLDDAPRNASVITESPTTLLVLGRREFAATLDSAPPLARKILTQMAHRLREADGVDVTH